MASTATVLKVLVTGGTGYIGRFCVRELVAAGHRVVVLDRRAMPPSLGLPAVACVLGDIADTVLVQRVLDEHGVDVVLHLAADKSVAESMAEPGPHLLNNVCGSLALFEAMVATGVHRIVFSSTSRKLAGPRTSCRRTSDVRSGRVGPITLV